MGIAFAALLGLTILFSIPLATAGFAHRMGRRFWLWFIIGTFLPVISAFIIFFLPDLSEKEVTKN